MNKVRSAVAKAAADLFAQDGNENKSAEELAEELADAMIESMVTTYEEIQAKSYNLIVLGHFRLDEDKSYVAAVGPLSTRAIARARGVGEHFAWDYKTRRGTGKFVSVPLIRDPNAAWDHLRKEQVPPSEVREALESAPSYYATGTPYDRSTTCVCGVKSVREGQFICPRHPEGRSDGSA